MGKECIPAQVAAEQAHAYWTDPRNFPVYEEKVKRTKLQKITNPQTRIERKRAQRFAGLVGAAALMAMMPQQTFTMYNGES